ncbi:MAG: peptidylprolyl isomerase [Porticoccaceae bacterium]|nr:peptidylprolyl isomerase [Porticoccaceae bacterium]
MITVNNRIISEDQVLAEMQYHPAENHREAMMDAAQSLIIAELIRQRARDLGLADEDDHNDVSAEILVEREVNFPTASLAECQQYYEKNPQKFTTSPLVSARHILLAALPENTEERFDAKNLAENIIGQLQQGEDFSALARQFSRCDSAAQGGSLGQLSKGQTVAEFERHVFNLGEGLAPHPIESRYGFHVVMVDQNLPGKLLPFEFVQERIETYLNEKVRRKAIAQYISLLVSEAEISGFQFDVNSSPLMQ